MYKVSKVNFVSMLTLNHSFESSVFPETRRLLQLEKTKLERGTRLLLMLTQRCIYFGGRVKGIGVSVFVTGRPDALPKHIFL